MAGEAGDVQAVFERYDRNHSGAIEVEELRALLADLGLKTSDSFVVAQFAAADADRDSKLSLEEFAAYYAKVTAPKLSDRLTEEEPEKMEALRRVFGAFASFGSRQAVDEMDGARFSKLCKDTGLVGSSLSTTDVDLIFARVKERGERRITFDQFVQALELLGEKQGEEVAAVVGQVVESGGPRVNNTTPTEAVPLHDDKSTYTGVYARGGPLTVDVPQDSFEAFVSRDDTGRRSPAVSCGSRTPGALTPGALTPTASYVASTRKARPSFGGESSGDVGLEALRDVFRCFATFGQGSAAASPLPSPAAGGTPPAPKVEMDSFRFAKLVRESGLLGGKLTTTGVDLAFTKCKTKGARKISFKQFMQAIDLLAQEAGLPAEEVKAKLAACEGPMLNGVTKADFVKFHDDKSTYTGVHVHGGPSTTNDRLTADRLMNRNAGRRLSGAMSPALA